MDTTPRSTVDRYLAAAAHTASAQNLINLTRRYFHARTDADARFPAADEDRRLIDAVEDDPALTITWRDTAEHWIARDRAGHRVCYTSGDLLLLC